MPVSLEAKKNIVELGLEKAQIKSAFPVDRYDCACHKLVTDIKKSPKKFKYIECPRSRKGMKKYKVVCGKCGEDIAELWATSPKLEDWCDLHYLSWHDLNDWHGCIAVNISPLDQTLGFECACGNDTRDFRLGICNIKGKELRDKISETMQGRDFGRKDSKFKCQLV